MFFVPDKMQDWLNTLPTPISISDLSESDAPLSFVNSAFHKITGYKPEECVGQNCRFLQGPETDPFAVKCIKEGLAKNGAVQVCLKNYRKSGEVFDNLLLIEPIETFEDRKVVVGCQYDINAKVWGIDDHLLEVGGMIKEMSLGKGHPWAVSETAMLNYSKSVRRMVDHYLTHGFRDRPAFE